jgi:hypothetical protein
MENYVSMQWMCNLCYWPQGGAAPWSGLSMRYNVNAPSRLLYCNSSRTCCKLNTLCVLALSTVKYLVDTRHWLHTYSSIIRDNNEPQYVPFFKSRAKCVTESSLMHLCSRSSLSFSIPEKAYSSVGPKWEHIRGGTGRDGRLASGTQSHVRLIPK